MDRGRLCVTRGLEEFVEQESAVFPHMDEFESLYEREMLAQFIEARLEDGVGSVEKLAEEQGFSEEKIREAA